MKKILHLFFIFLPLSVSLFFFIPQVKADTTYTGTISSDYFGYDSDGSYTDLKNYIDNYMEQNNLSFYVIIYTNNYSTGTRFERLYAYLYSSSPAYTFRDYDNRLNLYSSVVASAEFYKDKNNSIIQNYGPYALNNVNFYIGDITYGTTYMLIDTNIDFIYNGNNTLVFNSSYGSFTISNGDKLKGLVDIANSTPPDNTPLLTSFVDIVIEKLTLVCNFFTSSYIYLSIFVIFIFYFVIYLLRRFK